MEAPPPPLRPSDPAAGAKPGTGGTASRQVAEPAHVQQLEPGCDGSPGPGAAPPAAPARGRSALREISAVWRRPAVGIGLPLLLGLVHVALVAPHYRVGSFDDDASYILTAKALLAGHGLAGHLASGQVVVSLYAPGYGALIAPLVWLWPHSFVALRLSSVLLYAAVFPLTWVFMARRGLGEGVRVATLVVLALSPTFATFGSMVMAEGAFVVTLLLLLLALDRWLDQDRVLTAAGAAVVFLSAALIWLKQAGIALVAGLVLWLLLSGLSRRAGSASGRRAGSASGRRAGSASGRRAGSASGRRTGRWARAALVAGGVGLSLLPVVLARAAAGVPLAGSRYSMELGAYYRGSLLSRLQHVLAPSAQHLFATALPATLVPYLTPLPINAHWPDLWKVISWQVTVLALVGAVTWIRRYRDPIPLMVLLYLFESVLWPFVNERRTILILPVLAIWYVLGAATVWRAVTRWLSRRHLSLRPARAGAAVLVCGALIVPLALQLPRDYLFPLGTSSSQPEGSRYAAILDKLGAPSDVVETDYQSSIALFTGHATNWTAFTITQGICYLPGVLDALRTDNAGFLVVGDFNKPGFLDDPCLATLAADGPWAVRLMDTTRDNATVFELVGPGTGHPGLTSLLPGSASSITGSGATSVAQWDMGRTKEVTQVSVGEAAASSGPTRSVHVELRRPDGSWLVAATVDRRVGDGPGAAPYLLASFGAPVAATAVRVVVTGAGTTGAALLGDVSVVGEAVRGPTGS